MALKMGLHMNCNCIPVYMKERLCTYEIKTKISDDRAGLYQNPICKCGQLATLPSYPLHILIDLESNRIQLSKRPKWINNERNDKIVRGRRPLLGEQNGCQ